MLNLTAEIAVIEVLALVVDVRDRVHHMGSPANWSTGITDKFPISNYELEVRQCIFPSPMPIFANLRDVINA